MYHWVYEDILIVLYITWMYAHILRVKIVPKKCVVAHDWHRCESVRTNPRNARLLDLFFWSILFVQSTNEFGWFWYKNSCNIHTHTSLKKLIYHWVYVHTLPSLSMYSRRHGKMYILILHYNTTEWQSIWIHTVVVLYITWMYAHIYTSIQWRSQKKI